MFDGGITAPELSDEELDASEANVAAILDMLPDDEREVLREWFELGGDLGKDVGREVARRLGLPQRTTHDRLKRELERARETTAKFYGQHQAPEQYAEDLAGVEVAPVSRNELFLNAYRELRSIRKTAVSCGLSKTTSQRIVDAAA